MTTDPISLPALTPFELFEQLKTKGYQPRPCGDHVERGYCCPQALADAWEDFRDDPAAACEVMKRYLELDRKEVFRVWFGEQDVICMTLAGARFAKWQDSLFAADLAYMLGHADTCVDFILQRR